MKRGFTLAEVLITLGIIGIVAAMTIPTLITNINAARNRAIFKETLSILNQAVRNNVAHYGFDFSDANDCEASNADFENPETKMTLCAIFNGNLKGYTHTKYDITADPNADSYTFTLEALRKIGYIPTDLSLEPQGYGKQYLLPNGALFIFDQASGNCELPVGVTISEAFSSTDYLMDLMDNYGNHLINCVGFIDVNGIAPPNKEVTCSDGTETSAEPDNPCVVKNDAQHMTDIFPVIFHDGIVEPLSNAARYVLNTSK